MSQQGQCPLQFITVLKKLSRMSQGDPKCNTVGLILSIHGRFFGKVIAYCTPQRQLTGCIMLKHGDEFALSIINGCVTRNPA
jgi:hypothetical protein